MTKVTFPGWRVGDKIYFIVPSDTRGINDIFVVQPDGKCKYCNTREGSITNLVAYRDRDEDLLVIVKKNPITEGETKSYDLNKSYDFVEAKKGECLRRCLC